MIFKVIGAVVVAIIIGMGVVKALEWIRSKAAENTEGEEN